MAVHHLDLVYILFSIQVERLCGATKQIHEMASVVGVLDFDAALLVHGCTGTRRSTTSMHV